MNDPVLIARLQFALTAMFHILWPVLTIGLSLFLVLTEGLYLKTKDRLYYRQTRFWSRLFILNFAVGVVTGIPMEFQFGTNWSAFSRAGGDLFGHLLGFEATMAFMLEAAFLTIMIWGWNKVPPRMHYFATIMVAFGGTLSAFWIMSANAWMQTPQGGIFEKGHFVVHSSLKAIFSSNTPWSFGHMWLACLTITLFVIGGISAWYLLKNRDSAFFLCSFKIALTAAILVTPLQIFIGDGSGLEIGRTQPSKLAAIEAHWRTNPMGSPAHWNLLAWPDKEIQGNRWALQIPYMLSILDTHSLTGQVKGLREFPREDQPPIWLPFYAFRLMVGLGIAFFLLMLWSVWVWRRGGLSLERITSQKTLLKAWMAAVPLSYLAMEAGWATREVGRQPWIIYGILRTREGVSPLPAWTMGGSLVVLGLLYLALLITFLLFARNIIRNGPGNDEDGSDPKGLER
ncbi:MAG TPA: cytochrome ubiquinol oxidase subunit I [Thermodesulfobacteriota bacterium]|nr:cytochrome ubiquinol oxidase subunit I [Thermodesulfobacteriota bacterium]